MKHTLMHDLRRLSCAFWCVLGLACTSNKVDLSADTLEAEDTLVMAAQEDAASFEVDEADVADYTISDHKAFDPSNLIVRFEFDQTIITEEGYRVLDAIVAGMKKDPLAQIDIRGHADQQGTEIYNEKLSARRAAKIKNYLMRHGIEADRLSAQAKGDHDPMEEGKRVSAYKKNRRGDFSVNYGPSPFGR